MVSKSVVLMSLAGAAAIHFVLACSGSGSLGGSTPALADTPSASTCTKWEVQGFVPPVFTRTSVQWGINADGSPNNFDIPTFAAFSLPVGWEPISGGGIDSGITGRHCLSQ